jgi:hypothetical protein
MGLVRKLRIAAENPGLAACYVRARVSRESLIAGYRHLSQQAGLDRLHLVMSFDCDRPEDAAAALEVHRRLLDLGICPAYAVPGELLRKDADVYRRIAATGAEFLNHGHRWHMYYDDAAGTYLSCFFYDELGPEAVEQDVVAGDRDVTEIIGTKPVGFRTPHFGTYQRESELRFLHGVLRRLGYSYSSSTTPSFGFRYGPVFRRYGLAEVPVSGRGESPCDILDSWSCFAAPERRLGPQDYRNGALGMAERLKGGAGVLNYYCDPSHVVDQPIFFETMRDLLEVAEPTSFRQLLGSTARRKQAHNG